MGRHPKFTSEDDRQAARRASRRAYYARNRVRESARALERYHAQKAQRRLSRTPKTKETIEELPLKHTQALAGQNPDPGTLECLRAYATALQADLDTWTGEQQETDVWEDLTCRLMAAEGTRRAAKKILSEVTLKYQLATRLHEYAELGRQEAWQRGEKRSLAALERVSHLATRVSSGLSELVFLFEEQGQALLRQYEEDNLIWQST